MENFENLLDIYKQLRSCTNPDEVESLKKSLRGSIHIKKRRKESDENGGSEELGIQKVEKCTMSSLGEKSREVNKLIKEVKELAERGKFGDDLTIEVHHEIQVKFLTSNLVGEKFESYMHEISDLLTKNKTSAIGVWGMGGVGKTTLIRNLNNIMLDQRDIYGYVYWITVSKDCSIQKLQTDIAKRIGETISDNLDESQRAGILVEALKRKKKFVMILDDMWSSYDLNEVGLGNPKEIGYQLIVTSRSKDVCSKMNCDNIIKVDPLSQKDAWTLFVRSIGREIPDDLIKISIDVLKECAGLPLGIIVLAKSMTTCDDVSEWNNVLYELRTSSGEIDDMEDKVFKVLKWSYERLKNKEIKECLLYCATYPEDSRININELIWLFIDAGLLGKNVGMANMFNKGLAILKKLERVALLSIGGEKHLEVEEHVCLHDLIRDMALQIAGSRFMIKAHIGLNDIPDEENWTDKVEVVSLMSNEFEEILDFSPKCNRLSTLLLQSYKMHNVFDDFFMYLHGLKHLNLSKSKIRTLPKSISLLKSLTALIVRDCKSLEDVSSLFELSSLARLDLYYTSVRELPIGIGSLIKLRYLNLYGTLIRRIDAGVISKLTALQYLAMTATFEVKELNSLNNLEHLTAQFKDFVSFLIFIEHMKIKGLPHSYLFVLGDEKPGPVLCMGHYLSIKKIYLSKAWHGDTMSLSDFDFDKLCNPQEIKISDMNQDNQLLKILFGYHNSENRDNLQRSSKIERSIKLFCENELQNILQDITNIEILEDRYVASLEDFVFDTSCNLSWPSKIGRPKPFSNLKDTCILGCSNMKKLFSLGLLSNLQNIEVISVFFCEDMEELIEGESDESKSGGNGHPKILSLPKLKLLHFVKLSNLKRLCSDDIVIRIPSLQQIHMIDCPKLKRMAFDVDRQNPPFPQIFYEKSEKEWFDALEWDPPESKSMIDIKIEPSSMFFTV